LRDKVANELNLKMMIENNEDTTLEKKKDLQLKMLCGKLKSQMGNRLHVNIRGLKRTIIRLLSKQCTKEK
jgi:hypothetical protein